MQTNNILTIFSLSSIWHNYIYIVFQFTRFYAGNFCLIQFLRCWHTEAETAFHWGILSSFRANKLPAIIISRLWLRSSRSLLRSFFSKYKPILARISTGSIKQRVFLFIVPQIISICLQYSIVNIFYLFVQFSRFSRNFLRLFDTGRQISRPISCRLLPCCGSLCRLLLLIYSLLRACFACIVLVQTNFVFIFARYWLKSYLFCVTSLQALIMFLNHFWVFLWIFYSLSYRLSGLNVNTSRCSSSKFPWIQTSFCKILLRWWLLIGFIMLRLFFKIANQVSNVHLLVNNLDTLFLLFHILSLLLNQFLPHIRFIRYMLSFLLQRSSIRWLIMAFWI